MITFLSQIAERPPTTWPDVAIIAIFVAGACFYFWLCAKD